MNGLVRIVSLTALLTLSYTRTFAAEETTAPPQQSSAQEAHKASESTEKPLEPGWFGLECCVGLANDAIAEGKNVVQDALGVDVSGFFDFGWNRASSHPSHPEHISGRYFDMDYNRFQLNDFHIAIDKPEKDWGVGFHLSGDFGRTAQLLREATFWGRTLHHEPSAELRESYLTTTIPFGEGISVKGGLFVTPLGLEIIPAPGAYNDNISRSFIFNFGLPLRHLGTLFSYPVYKKDKDTTIATVSAGIVTGWDDPRDNNTTPSFLGGVTVTPGDTFSFTSNLIAGAEPVTLSPPNANNTARFTIDSVWTVKPIDPLSLALEYLWGHQSKASPGETRGASWQGVAGIASYSWTDRVLSALRLEWFNDRDGARLGGASNGVANVNVAEFTVTGSYKFTKMLMGRAEVRHDWSDQPVYRVDTVNFDKHQTTLALQLLYTF